MFWDTLEHHRNLSGTSQGYLNPCCRRGISCYDTNKARKAHARTLKDRPLLRVNPCRLRSNRPKAWIVHSGYEVGNDARYAAIWEKVASSAVGRQTRIDIGRIPVCLQHIY